jgi:1-acyl-sn-glycerol-3-phosphate acyltransferase
LLYDANIRVMTTPMDATSSDQRHLGGTAAAAAAAAGEGSRNHKREAVETGSVDDDVAGAAARRTDLPEKRFACRLLHAANRAYTHLYHHLEVFGACTLPKTGPAIVVCNHTSALDPHLVQSPCRRLITWMMAKEFYDLWYLKPVFRQLGVIPVTRSGRDTSATRAAIRALANGELLGIFPEGRIENSREMFPFQTGVALMAMKTGVPVYPAFLDGTQRNKEMLAALTQPQRARVIFGDEVQFDRANPSREGLSVATDAIQNAVATLRDRMDKLAAKRGL